MDKKLTRKEFLLSAFSIAALFISSKVPSVIKDMDNKNKKGNTYGNYSYGGGKKNA